jgi:hypothetical protein
LFDHLTRTQIENYGHRPFPAAEWLFVSDHLSLCEECRLKVEEAVDGDAAYLALKSWVFDEAEARSSTAGRWRRSVAAIHAFRPRSSTLVFGSALASLILAAAGWLGWQAMQRIKLKPEVAVTIPSVPVPEPPWRTHEPAAGSGDRQPGGRARVRALDRPRVAGAS